jgi:hypothetical protein
MLCSAQTRDFKDARYIFGQLQLNQSKDRL